MQLICGKNETPIKTWDYALAKKGFERKHYNLTVTDKRIIASAESNKSLERSEIYLSDLKSLDFKYERNGRFKAILLLIFGILTSLAIIGIFFIVAAVKLLKAKSFALTLNTYGYESAGFSFGASSILRRRKGGRVKVVVNKKSAMEIIDELGSIILDVKSCTNN